MRAEITLESDKVSYDPSSGIISANGNVRVVQTEANGLIRELYSERVEYNKTTGLLKLIGESIMREPNGDLMSAKNIELDREFKNAIAEAMIVVLKDSSKIKAEKGSKDNTIYAFDNVSYSPCRESSCSAPLWDLLAEKAIYDKKQKKFIYKNVKLRIKGVPVIFTPYFEHPSFDVKRKTGFLAPVIRSMSDVGFLAGLPFYGAIAPDRSVKITPFINSKHRFMMATEYNQLFPKADFNFSSSFLAKGNVRKKSEDEKTPRDKKTRWHADATIAVHGLENKRFFLRCNRASDVTYKSKYPVDPSQDSSSYLSNKFNDSSIIFESFDRSYFLTTDSHIYQTDDKNTSPSVYPHINFVSRKETLLGDFFIDSDTLHLTRKSKKSEMFAKNFFRSSNTASLKKSIILAPVLIDVSSGIRLDVFNIGESEEAPKTKTKMFPVLENQVGGFLPFESRIKDLDQISIWGPRVMFTSVQSSNRRKNIKQREDSVFDNFSDLNLHAINRFGGYDVIEKGERLSIGFENSVYNKDRRWLNFFIGRSQSFSAASDNTRGRDNVVGRLALKLNQNLSFRMRFVGMPLIEKTKQFEFGANSDYKKVFAGVNYLYDERINYIQNKGVAQIGFRLGYKINEAWKVSFSKILNIRHNNGKRNLAQTIFASYADECFKLDMGIFRTNFRDEDIKPRTGLVLSVSFKNLGNAIKSGKKHIYNESLGVVE